MTIVGIVFGTAFVVAGAILMVFSGRIGNAAERDVGRNLSATLADLVRKAPSGLDMQKRVFVIGVGFLVFGALFATVDPLLN
ncbi:hypothetical protein GCM10010413_09970 [Promicromonospora sukumoe]|uniref:Uncharacterized protein n=1 Tax=Promicromonospora sukumoe TaxID=88382 RepID=A0A7W3PCH7_9MICO|nr:hypothetical protein [Promicromonospora sukumoe]MBA8806666.1 hypothetical protein [Promicromonospora sukumoe]